VTAGAARRQRSAYCQPIRRREPKDGETVSTSREDVRGSQAGDDGDREPDGFVEVAAVENLTDGQMVGVEVNGERVLVANIGGEFYAIGGVCTHEKANLDEGSLCEGVVYCPLHFSAFDVRSGEVLGPPADRPTPTYQVKVSNGRLLVSVRPAADLPPAVDGAGDQEQVREEPLERARPWHTMLADRIGSVAWLGRFSDRFGTGAAAARRRLAPTGLLDLLHGRWFGHALHPALSDLPIGFWASSLFLYVIGQSTAAAILSVVGIASALAAAVTGVVDVSIAEGHERSAGLLHGLLMTGALLIQCASAGAYYFADALGLAIGFSVASFAVTTGAAHLGGHLVFGHGTMVNHTSWPPGPAQWVRTVEESELDAAAGRTVLADVGEKKVLLHRNRDGRISAIHNACSHAGAPLSLGKICDDVVTCPWHDSRFRMGDGGVASGPAIYPQPTFEVRVRDHWIEVRSAS
jgi:nitrite reductase/ring-hydroxylating ferredoxin subunit